MEPLPRITEPTPTVGLAPSHSPPDMRYVPGNAMARRLGWFSIGLGLAEILMPETIEQVSGVESDGLLRLYGFRELICGVGILSTLRPAGWLWGRVAGDALDLATAGVALANAPAHRRGRTWLTLLALAGVTAVDAMCAAETTAAAALEG